MTTVSKNIRFDVKGHRKRAEVEPKPKRTKPAGRVPRVSKLMALAIRFDQLIQEGVVRDQSELAQLAHVTQPRMTQIMNLLHLAPDIQEAILHLPAVTDRHDSLTERDLRHVVRMINWRCQREVWAKKSRCLRRSRSTGVCRHARRANDEDEATGQASMGPRR